MNNIDNVIVGKDSNISDSCIFSGIKQKNFYDNYQYCRLTRNLQMLGAFAFLSKEKQNEFYEKL